MLNLSRRPGEAIVVGENVEFRVLSIRDGVVNIGVTAPKEIPVLREELLREKKRKELAR